MDSFGVKEYLIVFSGRQYLERYCLKEGRYSGPEIYNWDEVLKLTTFEIEINRWEIFEKEEGKEGIDKPGQK